MRRPTADEVSRRAALVQVCDRTCGLAGGDEVLSTLRRRTSQALSMVARWIVEQRLVRFGWQTQRFLQMFQFEFANMANQPETAAVRAEPDGTFDDWELATWFVAPSARLQGRLPVYVQAVLCVARADRFVARG